MVTTDLQHLFFQNIKAMVPPNLSFVEEIADLLNISTDSAYRRIRGEKQISLEEIQKLSVHYKVSIDHLMNLNSNSIVFFGNVVDHDNFSFANHMGGMVDTIRRINKATKKILYYEAKDLPIFYFFQFTELAAFKYFFWMKTILAYREYNKMQFEDSEIMSMLQDPGLELIKTYNDVPSVEIWGVESVNTTIKQIEYFAHAGIFKKKETIENLFNQLQTLIEHIKDQAECGEKYLIVEEPTGKPDNYQLYFNEIFLGHNSLLVETDGILTSYINYGVLNYMVTQDTRFCDYTKNSMENTIKKSILISSVSEKERNRFFNMLRDTIARSRKELLNG